MLWSFAISQKVDEPILFAKPFFAYASAPRRKRSHFFIAWFPARSGKTITLIPAAARCSAVFLPCKRGSTSVV